MSFRELMRATWEGLWYGTVAGAAICLVGGAAGGVLVGVILLLS